MWLCDLSFYYSIKWGYYVDLPHRAALGWNGIKLLIDCKSQYKCKLLLLLLPTGKEQWFERGQVIYNAVFLHLGLKIN